MLGYRPTKQRYALVSLLLALVVTLGILPAGFAESMIEVDAQGRWLESGGGVETSGLAVDSRGQIWTVADSGALFPIEIDGSRARLGSGYAITKDGKALSADSEDLCALSGSRFFVVTERSPRLLEINQKGELLRQWPLSLNPPGEEQTFLSEGPNTQLEGMACSGREIFFAHERPPRIFMLQIRDGGSETSRPLSLVPIDTDLGGVRNLSGLHFVRYQGTDHLLALAPDQHLLLRLTLQRAEGKVVAKTSLRAQVRFFSPDSRELCRAKPEGITIRDGKIWIISDPPLDGTYRELAPGESRERCESPGPSQKIRDNFRKRVPLLFHLPLDAILPAVPGQEKVEPKDVETTAPPREAQPQARPGAELSPTAPATGRQLEPRPDDVQGQERPYESIRQEIERAGRQGDTRALGRALAEIDREIAATTDRGATICWQLLKGSVLVDLGQTENARAIFGMIADTCPIWEAFNNVAVLEAAEGRFGPAKGNLRQAMRCAGEAEARLPQGNLRKLFAGGDGLSLILVGAAKKCVENQTPQVDCSACEVSQ
jgi:uncharacterized protein YjiK